MKNFAIAAVLASIPIHSLWCAESVLALECIGFAEESIFDNNRVIDKSSSNNFVRRYELTEDKIVEYISTLVIERKRSDIEKKDDDSMNHTGYYRFEKSAIFYGETTSYKNFIDVSTRTFSIDRKTAAWTFSETYKNALLTLYGKDATKTLRGNGYCKLWDNKEKF